MQYKRKPIFISEYAPVGEWRLVDSRNIKFCVDTMYWFHWTDWKEVVNIPITKHKQLVCCFQMSRTQARHLACIYNIAE